VSSERFTPLIKELKKACDQQDWNELKRLDQQINSDIRTAIAAANSEQEIARLSTYLKGVQRIYKLIIDDSVKHRAEISVELRKITQDNKVANTYLDSSQYTG